MRRPNGYELKVLFVLSIVAPVGILVSLRLTRVLQEPPTLETITAESVRWDLDRPSTSVEFRGERIENVLITDEASVGTGVQIAAYRENAISEPFNGRDGIEFLVYINATLKPGFISSFEVRLYPIDSDAFVNVDLNFQVRHNVTVIRVKEIGTNAREAYILATTTNSSSYLRAPAYWVFQDQNIKSHQLRVVLEFTYRNISTYKKIVFPMQFEMLKDIGNTFDTAKNVTAGEHRGCIDHVDYVDMYSITLQEAQIINITLTPPKEANCDLYLYNPNYNLVANSTQTENKPEFISHVADETGTWYLGVYSQVWPSAMQGIYTLEIEVEGS